MPNHEEGTVVVDPVGRAWMPFHHRSWVQYLPEPRLQLVDAVPDGWGTCAIQAYADALTARMGILYRERRFGVDLARLIEICLRHRVLSVYGSSETEIGKLARTHGVPLEGTVPIPDSEISEYHGCQAYALGTYAESFTVTRLSHTGVGTAQEIEAALACREYLCCCLDDGPVVASFKLQEHYADVRAPDVPYRRLPDDDDMMETLSNGDTVSCAHSVVLYAYDCPGGDVRSLRLYYQDSMKDAAPRHLIDPDSIEEFHVPIVHSLKFSPRPMQITPPAEPTLFNRVLNWFS
ncbi:unnamed protein product [Urochloa humidicola]